MTTATQETKNVAPVAKVKKPKFTGKKKEKKVAKKATVKQGKGSTARRPRGPRLDPKAKVMKTGKAIDTKKWKEDGPRYARLALVLKNVGKTVEQIRDLKGLKETTLRTAIAEGIVKVAS
jgi:hypothetical protein